MTPDQKTALEHARHLIEFGVPIFLAPPAMKNGQWDPDGGSNHTGYKLPKEWQKTEPDLEVLDDWEPGMAVCALMGHTVDLLDVDPRNGGAESLIKMREEGLIPTSYGTQFTPSGGTHDFIATLNVRSRDKVLPGVDVKAGTEEGKGRGFAFLAPTPKRSKTDGTIGRYTWAAPPDLEPLTLIGADDSGSGLRELLLREQVATEYTGPSYEGRPYEELSQTAQFWVHDYVLGRVQWWRSLLAEAEQWDEGVMDENKRGWEMLTRDWVWTLAHLTVAPWTHLDWDSADELYHDVMPEAIASDKQCKGKWNQTLLKKVAKRPVEPPPWGDFEPVDDDDSAGRIRPGFDITSPAAALQQLRNDLGRSGTPLAGMFNRGSRIVHTPRVGEDGYIAPDDRRDSDGPSQVQPMQAGNIDAWIDFEYRVFKVTQNAGRIPMLFPERVARKVSSASVESFPHLRPLRGVTHTPIVRHDGSVLWEPGYDDATQLLYLPEHGLEVPPIDTSQLDRARDLIDELIEGFPFVTQHDRANFIACLLTPLLRDVTPPPYKLLAIGAPQPGSGKSLLARLLRVVHGGVFRSEFPRAAEELQKQILSILDATSAPIVQFDNVTGTLKSSIMEGLLTSAEWSDRPLGATKYLLRRNDRLWVITGNNLSIGGDLTRRTLWVTIDAGMEHPETRTDFRHPDLVHWAEENRGELLWALLTMITSWVEAGKPVSKYDTTDDYWQWLQTVRGILKHAGIEGVVAHEESVRQSSSEDDNEWALFLRALHKVFKGKSFLASEVVAALNMGEFKEDWLPDELAQKYSRHQSITRSLGRWLAFRQDRWADGLCVHQIPSQNRVKWYVEKHVNRPS